MMMKKSILLMLVLLTFACNKTIQKSNGKEVKENLKIFKIIDIPLNYDGIDGIDGIDRVEGYVSNPDTAVKVAESILFNIYKKELIVAQRPYNVFLKNNSIWCIEGNLSVDMEGGVFYIEIRKSDGAILKVLHTK